MTDCRSTILGDRSSFDQRSLGTEDVDFLFDGVTDPPTMGESLALVGVCGGAGTTRLSVEIAATLARAGRSVAVLDAAIGTQGLATHVDGRIDPDLTKVLTDEATLDEALVECWPDLPGEAALCPAHAPFERIARAKGKEAARRLADDVDRVTRRFDHVIVDVPPIASNPAVAAVTAADRRALVAPDSRRGADHLPRIRGRLVDVGTEPDLTVVTRAGEPPAAAIDADHAVPPLAEGASPTALDPEAEGAEAIAETTAGLFGATLDLEFPSEGLLG